MKFTPHAYQQQAIHFIETHPTAALFLGLGMGKTVITLTALNNLLYNHFTARHALVIAPIRVARDTWPQETTKWDHLAHLTIRALTGSPTRRADLLAQPADIYTIGKENIPWLVDHYKNTPWPFDTVIIDELSSFKNHRSKRFKALKKIRPHIHRIIGLTGTPAPNNLQDLWAQYFLLDQGQRLTPSITRYRDTYFHPGRRNGHIIYEWVPNPGAQDRIHHAITDITLSMTTADHLTLPPATTTTQTVHLTPAHQATYQELKNTMVTDLPDGQTIDAANAATLSGKLLQLASGAIYTDDAGGGERRWAEVHTAKLDALDAIINEAEGETILVAYWFAHERERIQARHPEAVALNTSQHFADWNAGKIPLALIHPASAGHGLNLQHGGHILVWTTTPWSLELYQQTNGRLNRQGQQHPVSIIHLAAEGTIDAHVQRALHTKNTTQQALIDAVAHQLPAPGETSTPSECAA